MELENFVENMKDLFSLSFALRGQINTMELWVEGVGLGLDGDDDDGGGSDDGSGGGADFFGAFATRDFFGVTCIGVRCYSL